MLFLPIILFSAFIALLIYYIFLPQQRYQYFKYRDIPTPPFQFFFGNIKTLWNAESYHRQLENWTKQYEKIYGIYEGTLPISVVSDPNFLEEVFIKQFSVFHARKKNFLDDLSHNIATVSGPKWHRQRHVINPTFTRAKPKLMSPLINGCISNLMEKLRDHVEKGNEFNIYLYYKRMTMDVICRCAFGIDTDLQNNPNNIYFRKIEQLFTSNTIETNLLSRSAKLVPEIGVIAARIFYIYSNALTFVNKHLLSSISSTKQLYEEPYTWLMNRLHTIVEQRQQTPVSRVDLLQLMLQVLTKEPIDDTKEDNKANFRLTETEIISDVFVFMAAEYETTSTALAYATYVLAKNPEIYPNHDLVAQMPYMTMFINEVLRMFPIANRAVQRRATADTVVQGIKIDKDSIIHGDMFSIHFDRELWGPEDPYVFYPERYETKRHSMAFLAFGAGSRNCVGMRFALIEMKILLTRLLHDYTILSGEHLETKFNIRERLAMARKKYGSNWLNGTFKPKKKYIRCK